MIVCVDNPANVRELDDAAAAFGVRPRVLVEVDSGMSFGVAPGEPTVALAKTVDASCNCASLGVMSWEGHATSIADSETRREEIARAIGKLTGAADAVAAGLPVDIVSCGGSGTYLHTVRQPGITEIQAGGAVMGDGFYRALESPIEPALTLLTTVTSRPAEDRIVDAGRRAIDPSKEAPVARGVEDVQAIGFSAEHGIMTLDGPTEWPRVGDRTSRYGGQLHRPGGASPRIALRHP